MSLALNRWEDKVCIVTGASAGIGEEVAKKLAYNGIKVVAVARRKEKLENLAKLVKSKGGTLYPFQADITKEDEILKLYSWVKANVGPTYVLVNSAGGIKIASLTDGDTKLWKEVFDSNVLGLSIMTREAIKCMQENNIDGHIIHINSLAGHIVPNFNGQGTYSASKYAVTALTETLRQELNSIGSKIKVTSISPAVVRTGMYEESARSSGRDDLIEPMKQWMDSTALLDVTDIADAVIYVLSTPPHVQVHEMIIRPIRSVY